MNKPAVNKPAVTAEEPVLATGVTEVPAKPEDQDDDTMLLGSSTLPASMPLGANEITLGELVRQSKKESGYSANKWNELSDETRDEHLNKTLERLRGELEKNSSTSEVAGDTSQPAEDVNIHAERAIGGSYVSLGGGERRRVGERSGGPVPSADPTEGE